MGEDFVSLFTLPLVAAIYSLYGQYVNLSDLIAKAEAQAKQILGRGTAQAEAAEKTANQEPENSGSEQAN